MSTASLFNSSVTKVAYRLHNSFTSTTHTCNIKVNSRCGQIIRFYSSEQNAQAQGTIDVTKLAAAYRSHPLSCWNIKPTDIHIKPYINHSGRKVPGFFYKNNKRPGITHVTPFSVVIDSSLSVVGSLGKKQFGTEEPMLDITKAEYELGIGCNRQELDCVTNREYLAYEKWLEQIFYKYMDHLSTHAQEYSEIVQRFGKLVDNERALRMEMEQLAFFPSKIERDEDGNEMQYGNYTYYKNRAFYKIGRNAKISDENPAIEPFSVDTLMKYQYNMQPSSVELYDMLGNPMKREEWCVRVNDIVSAKATIDAGMFMVDRDEDLSGNKKLVIYMAKRLEGVITSNNDEWRAESEGRPMFADDTVNERLAMIGWRKDDFDGLKWKDLYNEFCHRLTGQRIQQNLQKSSSQKKARVKTAK
eukprot:CFRG3944T1